MVHSNSIIQPALRITDVNFSYSDGTAALLGINLEVDAGESLAIIGPNGAGKSTLLLCMAGILRGGGDTFIQGQLLTTKNAKQLRRKVTLVFQDPDDQLFMPTLWEDVAFGPMNLGLNPDEVERSVKDALSRVNLWGERHRPPHHLSFGEKRRAALATALVMNADILLLDEPTSNLDPASRRELIEYLVVYPATRIVATHDLNLARSLCSRCILISDGQQVASGPIEELLSDLALLRRYRLAE